MRTVKVVVADDHPIVSRAITRALHDLPGFRVVATAVSGTALLQTLRETPFDMIVTDFSMQALERELDGLQLINQLRRLYPDTPIIVFTMLKNGGLLHQLCQARVAGIVGKEEEVEALAQICLRALSTNQTILSSGMSARLLVEGATLESFHRTQALSPREMEVVRLFTLGFTVTEIARRLNRSVATIGTQKRAAMRKLHVETNADLVRYAAEQGLE
jgi:two-component system, NarL family, captular synthesis response regulator RcsB